MEGGIEEVVELKLPAVLTIQTGINEPKYVSLAAILEAEDKEIKEIELEEIGILLRNPRYDHGSGILPTGWKDGRDIKRKPEEVVVQLTEIIKKKKDRIFGW